ncbi:somatomedin-B and thrombospondin type-1 domain-containing protein-like [Centruroides sculpturatus]|uniref:somatomedin-B and thrombospondin type-1 domain-containing protein-like n=1 Tax=Centruroides sculpturatus TaxID=218467 RepID=UPI000C6E591B|nr:somatomedin-B and thrombospondin type-1 domain-containing protein-like [Centruroides sculpturatus]
MVFPHLGIAFFVVVCLTGVSSQGSCRKAKLCCSGRDSSCVVQKAPVNAIIEDLSDKPCYCDHACLKVGDCCHDFKEACGVTDCEVSEWGRWSSCNVDCGTGFMSRERNIIQHPQNGGRHCPELIQKRGCLGTRCETKSVIKAHREMALILPSMYSQIRTANSTNDIRKNLRLRYPKDPAKESSKEYCIVFEVTKVRKACHHMEDEVSKVMTKGSQICVTCEHAAMRKHLGYRCNGHGIHNKPTRWATLSNPQCHGRWIRKEKIDQCPCHEGGKPDFIFV